MTNDKYSVEFALKNGANGFEMDLHFNKRSGKPTIFNHGVGCDCRCYDGASKTNICTLGGINPRWDHSVCTKEEPYSDFLQFIGKTAPNLALLYIDSKGGLSEAIQGMAGREIVKALEENLFNKFRGNGRIQILVDIAPLTMA